MAITSETPKSSEIEREIAEDRRRIEDRLDAIQQRMSPGQLVDEVLAYAKSSGGGEYVSNLGTAVKSNPVPAALVAVGLAWLMAGPKTGSSVSQGDAEEYPLATVSGDLRRTGPTEFEGGLRYTHFTDSGGGRFKALTDEAGKRAGHFVDASGRKFRGFADASGRQIHDIRDEAGHLLDEASGWVSKNWQELKTSVGKAGEQVADLGQSARDTGSQVNDAILRHFRDQPLVGGALAFAVGAAIGAALPRTQTEDGAFGEISDDVKSRVSSEVETRIDKAEAVASNVIDKATAVAADIHGVARDRIVEETQTFTNPSQSSVPKTI